MSTPMISSRMADLLRFAATAMRDGSSPLDHGFLVEHEVTLDEAYSLADWLAIGADALLELDQTPPGRRMIGVAIGAAASRDLQTHDGDLDARPDVDPNRCTPEEGAHDEMCPGCSTCLHPDAAPAGGAR